MLINGSNNEDFLERPSTARDGITGCFTMTLTKHTHACTHTHTHTHTQTRDRHGCEKESLEIVTEEVRIEGSFKRGVQHFFYLLESAASLCAAPSDWVKSYQFNALSLSVSLQFKLSFSFSACSLSHGILCFICPWLMTFYALSVRGL